MPALSLTLIWLMVLLIVLVAIRRARWLPERRVLPRSARVGNRTTHIAEAVVLLCAATAIFLFTATNTSTGGRLLILDQLRPAFALVNVLAAAAAGLGVLFGVLTALFWRSSTGVIIAAGILCAYGFVLNGPEVILESLAPEDSTVPDASLTFALSTPDLEGAKLYVNGVPLGTLPYETTYDEFYRDVPFRENEPNDYRREKDSFLHVPSRWHPGSSGPGGISNYPPWARIIIPERPAQWNRRRARVGTDKARTYYARVKWGDAWGYAAGHSGSWGGGGGRYERRVATVYFGFLFPGRQERLEKLLDLARRNDYAPGLEWFQAMETYRSDGWIAVRKAMDEEPGMSQVLDRWATWKYDLDSVTDAESAWLVFERIRQEADERQYYLTSDITGRAVELLTPRLDPDRLVQLARKVVRSTRLYSWNSWQMNGHPQFGMAYNPGGFQTGANYVTSYSIGSRGDQRLSPGDYAVAHAVWRLDKELDARDGTQPNIVERELVPAFIAQNYHNLPLLEIAAQVGGPAIERYLLRQDWRADPEDLPWKQEMRIGGATVNGWLYLLASLPSRTGRQFRQKKQPRLMEMADRLNERSFQSLSERHLGFLFRDLDTGSRSLALSYWPRFKEATAQEKHDALSLQYQHLVRMEPLPTVDMYVQCWQEFRGDPTEFYEALDSFAQSSVPYRKRQEIHAALADTIRRDIGNIEAAYEPDKQRLRRDVLARLEEKLLPITDQARAEDLLAALRAGSPRYKPENVAAWLAHGTPAHRLVRMLAEANEPSLRLLVMGALREHPTPAHRAILQRLLHDPDEQVRGAAQAVAAELTALEQTPAAQLADRKVGPAVQ